MFRKNFSNDKKKVLLAQKEKLLQEIKYYEKRIEEFSENNCVYYGGNNSSDSEDDFRINVDIGPSISELKQQDRMLKTCLQATQELTSLRILQSEVNVMIEDPVLEGEKPVTEPGSWKEVTAECRIDLVPFSMTFYMHQPSRKFGARGYRSLRVLPVKTSHEVELAKSVLSSLDTPSDAVEVLRSYAAAYRSRRTTLARLADRYTASLFMQPQAEGGFIVKCANLLVMSWLLENKTSAVAPFHHKLNFELEYMDESYLKIIKQVHRQLSDPSLQTDERTQLLSKIISVCLEAQSPTQELHETLESDPESIKKLEKTTLDEDSDEEIDNADAYKKKRDEEVMAPPKSIPKKAKPKAKENMDENRKSVKRTGSFESGNTKKARTGDVTDNKCTENVNTITDIVKKNEKENVDKNKGKAVNPKYKEKNQNVAKDLTERNKENVQKESTTVKPTKVIDKGINGNKIAGSSKDTNPKEAPVSLDNAKSNENAPAMKVAKNDNTKTSQSKLTGVGKNTKSKKNVNEKNILAESKSVKKDNDKNALLKNTKNDEGNSKNSAGNKNCNVAKTIGTNYPKSTEPELKNTEKSNVVNPKNSKNDQNKKPNNENQLNVKKTDVKQKTQVDDNAMKTNNAKSNPEKNVNSDMIAKKSTNAIDQNKNVNSNAAAKNVKKSDMNTKKTLNTDIDAKKNEKCDVNVQKNVISDTKAKKNATEKSTKVINVVTKNKEQNSDKNVAKHKTVTGIPAKSIASKHTKTATVKNVASSESTNLINVALNKNGAASSKKTSENLPKNIPKNQAKIKNIPKNIEKSIIVIRNHRNSSENVSKKLIIAKTLKPSVNEIAINSKIPKKLSPAYAAVLKQNPVRISPRMLSKFKSSSDSNIKSKLFKQVTNIPRLLKPAPKSK